MTSVIFVYRQSPQGMVSALAVIPLAVFCGLLALLFIYFIRILAYRMAVNRHRDPLGWALTEELCHSR